MINNSVEWKESWLQNYFCWALLTSCFSFECQYPSISFIFSGVNSFSKTPFVLTKLRFDTNSMPVAKTRRDIILGVDRSCILFESAFSVQSVIKPTEF